MEHVGAVDKASINTRSNGATRELSNAALNNHHGASRYTAIYYHDPTDGNAVIPLHRDILSRQEEKKRESLRLDSKRRQNRWKIESPSIEKVEKARFTRAREKRPLPSVDFDFQIRETTTSFAVSPPLREKKRRKFRTNRSEYLTNEIFFTELRFYLFIYINVV